MCIRDSARGSPPSTAPRILRRMAPRSEIIHVAGREVTVTNPDKVFFPAQIGGERTVGVGDRDQDRGNPATARAGHDDAAADAVADAPVTKLDLVRYYLAVADGALRGAGGRPMALKRYPNGAAGPFFFQKRAPESRPAWIPTVTLSFPSGRTADEVVIEDAAQLAWVVNLGCLDLNPHPVRADDLDHPDELRVDLDPVPGVEWDDIRRVALVVRDALADVCLLY